MEEKKILLLELEDVLPNRFQPRIRFNEAAINELAESIKKYGVIQPIVVRQIGDKYEIIAGERRYKASVLAGKATIPAIVANLDDRNSAEIALIENVQRQDLTPIEEAVSYKKILDMGYLTQTELADKLGKEQSTVANKLRLLNLSEVVQEALLEEKISERHARSLLKLDEKTQQEILKRILNERMTVRKTDELIDSMLGKVKNVEILDFNEAPITKEEVETTIPTPATVTSIIETPTIAPVTPEVEEPIKQEPLPVKEEVVAMATLPQNPQPFSIPVAPVEETVQPGFLDIKQIEETAKDIYAETPKVDVDVLLKSDTEVPAEPTEELVQGKFFSFVKEKEVVKVAPILEKPTTKEPVVETKDQVFNFDAEEFDKKFKDSQDVVPEEEKEEINPVKVPGNIKNMISEIRKCSANIEAMGYKIEVEELDFENMYQAIFKVEKK